MILNPYPPLPLALTPGIPLRADLCGAWRYAQPLPKGSPLHRAPGAHELQVPGEVVMQGLPYAEGAPVALEREIEVPRSWARHSVRVRFEAVYSACVLFVDGARLADHEGGFTPFDVDITGHVSPGAVARITLHVRNEGVADLIGFGSRYADHPLIGIPRKAFLYALPKDHLLDVAISTLFEDGCHSRARLHLGILASAPIAARLRLHDPDGQLRLSEVVRLEGTTSLDFAIDRPQLWDTEAPHLYSLSLDVEGASYARSVGFREIAVHDRKLTLNGRPIRLRGVNHHETHPLTGRADTARWAETDVRLFREAHVNFLRTSHYPPTIELVEACDRAGMLLEVEAPVCFAFGQFDYMPSWDALPSDRQAEIDRYIHTATLEMVAFYRSHPSVILWSVANESHWAPPFARSAASIRAADPTRPLTYNWWKLNPACRGHVEIANSHYPEAGKVAEFADEPRPILFDEFAHLFCYNDRELATDPGLRHLWGSFLEQQWTEIITLGNGVGGSIWAAIDDWFAVPHPSGGYRWRGYGEWGPIDGWRRRKPEHEEMKRVFDPVHLLLHDFVEECPVTVEIENRFDRADLSELSVSWRLGSHVGEARLAGGPGTRARFETPAPRAGDRLEIDLALPRLAYRRRVTAHLPGPEARMIAPGPAARLEGPATARIGGWRIAAGAYGVEIAHDCGQTARLSPALIPRVVSRRHGVRLEDPEPIGNDAADMAFGAPALSGGAVTLVGKSNLADARIEILACGDELAIAYHITLRQSFEPFQTGIEFFLPPGAERLHWHSGGERLDFPDDHPARGAGIAHARRGDTWPRSKDAHPLEPCWPWALEETAQGTNDFRSTKRNIRTVSLTDAAGRGLVLRPVGRADSRAQCHEEGVSLFLLDFSSHGSERFLESFAPQVALAPGDKIAGHVVLGRRDEAEEPS